MIQLVHSNLIFQLEILESMKNFDNPTTTFKLIFEESQSSVTPGQAAVFYKGEILLGGGSII